MVTVILRNHSAQKSRRAALLRRIGLAGALLLALCAAPGSAPGGELRPPGGEAKPASGALPAVGLPSTLIELDGTASSSPDGGTLTYEWKQIAGPKIELSDSRSAKPYFRTSQPGVYEFELVVEANGLKSEPHLVRLEIERENLPPVAKIYPEAWGQVGKILEVDARESFDPEGEELTYRWRPLTNGLAIPPAALTQPVLSFEPVRDGVFEVELVVSDGEKVSNPVVCRLNIKPRPKPPVARVQVKTLKSSPPVADSGDIAAMSPPAAIGGESGAQAVMAAPPPAPPPPSLMIPPPLAGGQTAGGSPAAERAAAEAFKPLTPIAAPPAAPPGSPSGGFAPLSPIVSRQQPVARIAAPAVVRAGEMVMLDGRNSWSASGNRLEYFWRQKSGAFISDFELVFDGAAERFTAPRPGDYEFELVVFDAGADSAPAYHTLRVVKEEDPPVAVVVAPTRAMPGALVKLDATQSYDLAGSRLVYRWRQTGGPAVKNYVIDEALGDAAPAFHPPTPGVYSFELVVSNGRQNSRPIEIDIEVGDARLPPPLSIVGPEVATTGERLYLTADIGEHDPAGLTFSWLQTEGPANALVQTRGPRGLVQPPLPGRYVFEVSAQDGGRAVAKASRVLEVFKAGGRSAPGAAGMLHDPLPLPPVPQPAEADAGARRRSVVPELAPPAVAAPAPTSFPDPQAANGGKRVSGRKPAQVLQGGVGTGD